MTKCVSAVLGLLLLAAVARAERPPQFRDAATLVVSGTVKKLTTKTSPFGGDGVRTDYTAEVAVEAVEKGDGAKAGDTVAVTWFRVTKRPTRPFAGAFGQDHGLKEKDRAKFWLLDGGEKAPWNVIYNTDGVEKTAK